MPGAGAGARDHEPYAWFGGLLATGLREVTEDPAALEGPGWWAVVATFEGVVTCARFEHVRPAPLPPGRWRGPPPGAWTSSLDRTAYLAAVAAIRAAVAAGEVYQVNLCRVLTATPGPGAAEPAGLARVLAAGNPAPYGGVVELPGLAVVSASPELFLEVDGDRVRSRPVKGTAATGAAFAEKDTAENVMITDLVRNDLGPVCTVGSIEVPALLAVEEHPTLRHLVSTVQGRLRPGVRWPDLLAATFPPGSVSGAPKSSALRLIRALEPVPRGPYCGAVGWVDGRTRRAQLAVAIRTFWLQEGELRFGTGAGITWGSDAAAEWEETELKARHLVALASAPAELEGG